MTRIDAEKLLGGHATGTLTEVERAALFAAALDHQEVFDALMDEEALRELLADPAAKAQLLAALAPVAAPMVVPLWRRTGVLGAGASLLVASLAGLAYLRSPDKAAPALRRETEPAPAAKVAEAAPATQVVPPAARNRVASEKAKEAPAPTQAEAPAALPPSKPVPLRGASPAAAAPVAVAAEASREKATEFRRAEAQDQLAKKAEAPKPAAAVVEVLASVAPPPAAQPAKRDRPAQGFAELSPGVVSGVVGGVAPASPRRVEWKVAAEYKPAWTLEPGAEGLTRLQVKGPEGATAVLLKRGAAGVAVVQLERVETRRGMDHWRGQVRLAGGEVLDLYLLNSPTAEPERLPEVGPVDGFRARIYPASRN
ncbi:MAG: hypothetical protein LWW79_08860 [Holophagaceae bacterium]|nr:hypothetical protein [Holophagaceae bacterium]